MKASEVVERLQQVYPGQPEYIQAVSQVLGTIEDEYNKHPEFDRENLIERLCIPDRIIKFRVNWIDDKVLMVRTVTEMMLFFAAFRRDAGEPPMI